LYNNLAFVEGSFSVLYSTGLLERKLGRELDVTWGQNNAMKKAHRRDMNQPSTENG
jgi:hypothetical protein